MEPVCLFVVTPLFKYIHKVKLDLKLLTSALCETLSPYFPQVEEKLNQRRSRTRGDRQSSIREQSHCRLVISIGQKTSRL